MKSLGNWVVLAFGLTILLASCFDPPVYSPTPTIEFESVAFKDVADASEFDSLILTIQFKDGDGDMGLDENDPSDTLYPYQSRTFFDTIPGSNIGYYYPYSDGPFITYKTKRTNINYDTLPAFVKPYNCVNWEILTIGTKIDTFYYQRNINHYNIFVEFLVKNNDGTFTEFDWTKEFAYPQCGITFDGRFPVLSKDLSQNAALDGRIRYGMTSRGFLILFSIKTLKLRVTIQDRTLRKSNTIETPEFTLQQIK